MTAINTNGHKPWQWRPQARQWWLLWPLFFVAVIVMVCDHYCLWTSLSWFVTIIFCGRHCHGLWPLLFMAIIAVAVISVVVIAHRVAIIVCGHHCRTPWHRNDRWTTDYVSCFFASSAAPQPHIQCSRRNTTDKITQTGTRDYLIKERISQDSTASNNSFSVVTVKKDNDAFGWQTPSKHRRHKLIGWSEG